MLWQDLRIARSPSPKSLWWVILAFLTDDELHELERLLTKGRRATRTNMTKSGNAHYGIFYFTRAAERCGVTQPSLTKAIKNLELKLGGKLFDRNKSETQLTELGELVRPRMQRIDQEVTYALQIARQTKVRKIIMSDR